MYQHSPKKSIQDFNLEEARGWTIERLLQIEYRINDIILKYFSPKKKNEFKEIILNNSILDFGSKMKILANIGIEKGTIEDIRRLASIRNGFAHAPIRQHINVQLGSDEKGIPSKAESESIIYVMNSSGKIQKKNAKEYLDQFWVLNKKIIEKLSQL